VPRDLEITQIRLDFSNEANYWERFVDKAAGSKRKRSLKDFGDNHRRWLEEAWREDLHGGLGREELPKRWFGTGVLEWVKGVLAGVTNGLEIGNTYKDDFTVILNEQYGPCTIKGVKVDAKLDVRAQTHVEVETNFGLTIITTLRKPIDLKNPSPSSTGTTPGTMAVTCSPARPVSQLSPCPVSAISTATG
jgi:chitinase